MDSDAFRRHNLLPWIALAIVVALAVVRQFCARMQRAHCRALQDDAYSYRILAADGIGRGAGNLAPLRLA